MLFAGYAVLSYSAPPDTVRGGAGFAGVQLSGRSVAEAAGLVEQICESRIDKGMAQFTYRETRFLFHFSEIGLTADYSHLADSLTVKGSAAYYNNLFTAFIRQYGADPSPLFSVDASAFRGKLDHMKSFIDSLPVNADINYSAEAGISRSPSWQGAAFDVDGQFDYIMDAFLADPFLPLALDSARMITAGALLIEEPRVADSMLSDVDAALGAVSAPVPQGYDMPLLAKVAEAINKVWIPKKGTAGAPFSFMRYLDEAGLPVGGDAPQEYNFVATALMHALLAGGCDLAAMEAPISHSQGAADYSGLPGFGINLSPVFGESGGNTATGGNANIGGNATVGGGQDFIFTNSLESNIVIFAEAKDGELAITVAGSSALSGPGAAPHDIHSTIEDGKARLYKDGKNIAEQSLPSA